MSQFSYLGFRFKQRVDGQGPAFFLFHAPVGEIAQWADVQRLAPGAPRNVQREPVKSRINSIKRYFVKESENTIPTAIVVALRQVRVEQEGDVARLFVETRSGVQNPGLVIDGQHRLRGMQAMDPGLKAAVVAILEPDPLEVAFQFLVINNKAARVPRDHLRALTLNYRDEDLRVRLESARLSLDENVGSVGVLDEDEESPFRGMIAWPNNHYDQRVVVPAAIEMMAGFVKSLGVRELDEADALNLFLMAIWRKIKSEWSHIFNPKTHLLEKVGLICLTQFIVDTMRTWSLNPRFTFSFGDPDQVEENTGLILQRLEPALFQAKWGSASYDTRAGRDQITMALETISRNITNNEPWYTDVQILDAGWLEEHLSVPAVSHPPDPG